MQDQSKLNNQPEVVTGGIFETRSNVAALNNQLGTKCIHHQFRILNNMCEGFVCSLRSFKCWIPCGTDNQHGDPRRKSFVVCRFAFALIR